MAQLPSAPRISYASLSYHSPAPLSPGQEQASPRPTAQLANTRRVKQFIKGLTLALLLTLLAWLFLIGSISLSPIDALTFTVFVLFCLLPPFLGVSAAIALITKQARRWIGIGLLVGMLIYLMIDCFYLTDIFMRWAIN
ncbi:MAG TPA: hypothetical protein VF099_08970 [Ktedonobacterales bacterium]